MRRRRILLLVLALAGALLPLLAQRNAAATTLTGVVYQKDDDFVIAEPENMTPLAVLQGVEFSNGNFANYVGQTVRVRGVLVAERSNGRKILRVRRLSDIEKIDSRK